jgi:hypothetical protein
MVEQEHSESSIMVINTAMVMMAMPDSCLRVIIALHYYILCVLVISLFRGAYGIYDFLLRAALEVAEFCLEVDAHSEDTTGIGECLGDIPEHSFRDIPVVAKERHEGENDARDNHRYRR